MAGIGTGRGFVMEFLRSRRYARYARAVAVVAIFLVAMGQATPGSARAVTGRAAAAPSAAFSAQGPYTWGLLNDDGSAGGARLAAERGAGVTTKVVRISWKDMVPAEGTTNAAYIGTMRARFDGLRAAGFGITLELGIQDTPDWVHTAYPAASYVDQYGDVYSGQGQPDSGDANAVFNPTVRRLIADYVRDVFASFGADFAAVRLGGGHWGELTYPTNNYNGHTNCYWAFDPSALAQSPVPSWRPGDPSPHGEAARFIAWYLDALTGYQTWQISMLRASYSGPIVMLYPSFGVRPGQLDGAVRGNLDGTTSVEINGELQRGYDMARQVAAIADPNTVIATTWLDCPFGNDDSANPDDWRPVHYLASLAAAHAPALRVFGENTGQGQRAQLDFAAAQVVRYGLVGMAWYDEGEVFSGRYATLTDYQSEIANTPSRTIAATPTATATATRTATPTSTPTATATRAATPTGVPTGTGIPTATSVSTAHPTPTGTNSPTRTPSLTPTNTAVALHTATAPVPSPTNTRVALNATNTSVPSPTTAATAISTARPTATNATAPTTVAMRTAAMASTMMAASTTPATGAPLLTVSATATPIPPTTTTSAKVTTTPPSIPTSTRTATPGPATPGPATPGPATPGPATPGPATPGPATPTATRHTIKGPVGGARHPAVRPARSRTTSRARPTAAPSAPPRGIVARVLTSAPLVVPGETERFTVLLRIPRRTDKTGNESISLAVYDRTGTRLWQSRRYTIGGHGGTTGHVSTAWRAPLSVAPGIYTLKVSILDVAPTMRSGDNRAATFRVVPRPAGRVRARHRPRG